MSNPTPHRLVIAGGGTGGHVHPALAVIEEFKKRGQALDLLWIGSHGDVEGPAADRAGIPFRAVQTGNLRRYLAAETVLDVGRLPIGAIQAWRILRRFGPDVIFSTGGFVSVPSVAAGARIAPILTHEQTAILGMATKINLRFADVLAVSFERSATMASKFRGRVVTSGNPVRETLNAGVADRGLAHYGFTSALPLLYVTGGARGATPINTRIAPILPRLLAHCQILHQAGPPSANNDLVMLGRARDLLPNELQSRYAIVDFVRDELADVYAAASLVLGRAGAGTVADLAFLGKPGLLIPLPGSGGGEQVENARVLESAGGAVVLPQDQAAPERLANELTALLQNSECLQAMGERARSISRPCAAADLADELLRLAGRL
jgi:UDP-N-acetylglucosamine--N-acetylmuramyl-(pentapeptide) pyrophosphoryl-undecaprenol N-acetylglucosamine transferase